MSCELWEGMLDTYVDGETSPAELPALEEHLRACRDCAAQTLARMQMKRATRAAAMRFTPPPELRRRIENSIRLRRNRLALLMSPALAIAAALVLVIAISSLLYVRRAQREQAREQMLDMHVTALASANPVDVVSSDRHTVKPWFQGKLPFTFNLPELAGSQYKLNGGKLVYFRGKPAAQLIFELRKHELSVFIVQDGAGSGGVSDANENGFSTESWTVAGLRYVVISDAGPADVHALGDLLRTAQQP
jgi:anti-sigma factor RsiW